MSTASLKGSRASSRECRRRAEASKRTLEPWGVVNRRGHWYVAGHDRDRDATRVFRLSRIEGPVKMAGPTGSVTVPDGTDVRELVKDWNKVPDTERKTATLRVREGAGPLLRKYAQSEEPGADGWDIVRITYPDADWYAEYLASFGPGVVVLDPPELRDAVVKHLRGVLS